jgi:hypothetical protein
VSTVAALSYKRIGVPCRTDNKNAPARRLNAAVFGVVAIILVAIFDHPACTPTEASWLNLIEAQFGVLK